MKSMTKLFYTFIILSHFMMIQHVYAQSPRNLGTYLPSYRMKQLFPQDISGRTAWYKMHPYGSENGTNDTEVLPIDYSFSRGELILKHFDEVYFFSLRIPEKGEPLLSLENRDHLTYLQRLVNSKGPAMNLCISGSSSDFIPLLRDDLKRSEFLEGLEEIMDSFGLSGLDLDWEFPGNDQEKEFYSSLLGDLRSLCDSKGKKLTIAASRFHPLPAEAYSLPDKIHLMTYDFFGRHSTAESTREALEYMMARYEIPPEKLIMGIPFYGRIFDGYSPDYWKKAQSYREIIRQNPVLPHEDEAEGYYFNGPETVQKKTEIAEELSLGGFFVWEIGQDSLGKQSLTRILWESQNS
ncbi:glycoside hydrolase family 18 protein [Oceanispirochaeta sp.]|jgi:chitinase|uniref:glycoside hydrolase family 18 protein n=1 Tax=Oceanispirochaeta sp. TaxID=2035350 RepID=UPI00261E86DC|nr:glycoside hydrolase family 18 protein [Oceanispirochaeta sp.]MDA3958977.1 glycoside hydrolase family 18 protein [Oceanispirochaeta sp.]